MKALWIWIFILIGLAGAGKRVFRFFGVPLKAGLEECVWALGVGLGAMAYLVYFVGSAGFLTRPVFMAIVAALFIIGIRPFAEMAALLSKAAVDFWKMLRFWERALLVMVLAVFGLSLCGALAPAIGQDELCYHLMQPKNYVRAHAVYEVPYSSNSLWPYLLHMLFTLGLLLEGDSLAKLFHFSTYLLTALAIFSFLKREAGPRSGFYGLAVFALTPVAFIQASFAYVDNALSFYIFLTFYAFYLYLKEGNKRWAVLAGVFAGFAVSVKLIGLFILPVLALAALPAFFRSKKNPDFFAGAAGFLAAFLACGSLWYIRAWILRGNPVYPFYPEFFGGHGWKDPTYLFHGGARGIRELLLFPWNLTMRPGFFGGEQPGPVYLALLPLLIFLRSWPAWLRAVIFFGAAYTLIWFKVDPNTRFLLPALAFFACGAGFWLSRAMESPKKIWKAVAGVLCGAMFLAQGFFAAYHFKDAFFILFHRDRAFYLRQKERSHFAAQTVNRFLAPSDKIISAGEIRGYYFDNPFVLEGDFRHMTGYPDQVRSGGELVHYLKAKGFTHALDTDITPAMDPSDPEFCLSRFLKEGNRKEGYFKEVLRVHSGDVRYVLYKIIQQGAG